MTASKGTPGEAYRVYGAVSPQASETHSTALKSRREKHDAVMAARKLEREKTRAEAKVQGGLFIGPPNPFLFRKGRPPMKVK